MKIVTSREDYIDKFILYNEKKIVKMYEHEWVRYVDMCKKFLKELPIQKAKMLLLDHVEDIPKGTLQYSFNYETRANLSEFLFKSLVLAMSTSKVNVGTKLSHHLPLSFKIFIKPDLTEKFKMMDRKAALSEFNKIIQITLGSCKKYLKDLDFDCCVSEAFNVREPFETFTFNIIMIRTVGREELLLAGKKSIETLRQYYKFHNVNDFSKESFERVLTPGGHFIQNSLEAPLLEFVTPENISMVDNWLIKVREEAEIFKAKCDDALHEVIPQGDVVFADMALNVVPGEQNKLHVSICTKPEIDASDDETDGISTVRFDRKPEEICRVVKELMASLRNSTLEHSGIRIYEPVEKDMYCKIENGCVSCTVVFEIDYPDYVNHTIHGDIEE